MTAKAPQQMVFDLPYRPAFGREDFYVSSSNEEAVAWIDRWPEWPAPALVLYGPASSGKTHLLSVWHQKTGAVPFSSGGDFESAAAVTVDDAAQYFQDAVAEQSLFHLYNVLKGRGGHMLLTSETAPGTWQIALKDLSSRLLAAPAVALQAPDDTLLAAVLLKLFKDRQLKIGEDVLSYLVPRMHRSLEEAARIVDILDKASLAEKRNITIPLIRQNFSFVD